MAGQGPRIRPVARVQHRLGPNGRCSAYPALPKPTGEKIVHDLADAGVHPLEAYSDGAGRLSPGAR
jgi:hypothetical protein